MKGVQTLIETFRTYRKAKLVVVGDGTYAGELRRLAAGVPNVTFLGFVAFTELASLYKDAIAVIAPSIGYETFGMTSIEGFVHGTPAIVRDLGALPEPVRGAAGASSSAPNGSCSTLWTPSRAIARSVTTWAVAATRGGARPGRPSRTSSATSS